MEKREFTEDERHTIDSIYARNKENLTADEIDLLLAWETQLAMQTALYKQEADNLDAELTARLQQAADEHDQAVANMNAMHQAALDRLQEVMNLVQTK